MWRWMLDDVFSVVTLCVCFVDSLACGCYPCSHGVWVLRPMLPTSFFRAPIDEPGYPLNDTRDHTNVYSVLSCPHWPHRHHMSVIAKDLSCHHGLPHVASHDHFFDASTTRPTLCLCVTFENSIHQMAIMDTHKHGRHVRVSTRASRRAKALVGKKERKNSSAIVTIGTTKPKLFRLQEILNCNGTCNKILQNGTNITETPVKVSRRWYSPITVAAVSSSVLITVHTQLTVSSGA